MITMVSGVVLYDGANSLDLLFAVLFTVLSLFRHMDCQLKISSPIGFQVDDYERLWLSCQM